MAECWLYLYEHVEARRLYIGIGDSMGRVFEGHNAAAEELRDAPGAVILQTVRPFSSRADARKAEAIAIHVATLAGFEVTAEDEGGAQWVSTNIAGTVSTSELGPAIFMRAGFVDASTLHGTVFVPISPGSIDGRVAPFGGRAGAVFAERVSKYWNVSASKRARIVRAVAVLTGGRNLVLGDWDVDTSASWRIPDSTRTRVEIPLADPSKDDPRGIKGMRLVGHRSNSGVTYSSDLRS